MAEPISHPVLLSPGRGPAADGAERRAFPRRLCPPDILVGFLAVPGGEEGEAVLWDISEQGIGLVLNRPLAAGSAVFLELPAVRPGAVRTQIAQVAEVVHAAALPGGRWLVGCHLGVRLGADDLRAVLRNR
jgi:PilZ domain